MASKKASKSRQRQSISDLSPRERQAKGVRGGRRAAVATPDVTAGRVVVEKRPGASAGRQF